MSFVCLGDRPFRGSGRSSAAIRGVYVSPLTWFRSVTNRLDAVCDIHIESSAFVLNVAKHDLRVGVVNLFVGFDIELFAYHSHSLGS